MRGLHHQRRFQYTSVCPSNVWRDINNPKAAWLDLVVNKPKAIKQIEPKLTNKLQIIAMVSSVDTGRTESRHL